MRTPPPPPTVHIKRMKLNKWRNIIRLKDPLRNNRFQYFLTKQVKVFYCISIEWKNWVICIFLLLPNCQLSPPVTLHCKTSLIKLLPSLCHIRPSPQLLNKHGQVFCNFKFLINFHKYKNQDKCAYWTKHLPKFNATSLIPPQPSKWVTLNGKIIIIK